MKARVRKDKDKVALIVEGATSCGLLLYSFVLAALWLLLYGDVLAARLAEEANAQMDLHV